MKCGDPLEAPIARATITDRKYHHYRQWKLSREQTTVEGITGSIAFLRTIKFKTTAFIEVFFANCFGVLTLIVRAVCLALARGRYLVLAYRWLRFSCSRKTALDQLPRSREGPKAYFWHQR